MSIDRATGYATSLVVIDYLMLSFRCLFAAGMMCCIVGIMLCGWRGGIRGRFIMIMGVIGRYALFLFCCLLSIALVLTYL
jgi:hypothetical protein